jgi:Las17-binding protein actin regulator
LALTGDVGLTLGAQAELTLLSPKGGRHVNWKTVISNQGHVMMTVAVSISRGLMVGISLEGTIIQPNAMVNESFYQQSYTPIQILYDVQEEEMFLSPPNTTTSDVTPDQEENDATMRKLLRNVYIQLEQLRRGDTWEPPPSSSSPSDDVMKLNENLK